MATVTKLEREFVFESHILPDPDPAMDVERVREMYIATYPEITTASVEGPTYADGKKQCTVIRAIGYKG